MSMYDSDTLYQDLKERTNGEIYLGVVGPVRTGKSTFIKHFMEALVLPNMTDVHNRSRAIDELPQSAKGTTIMTTEPKFVPQEAVSVTLGDSLECKFRLIDCVGFMVDGALGHEENGKERMVKTPWYDYDIPFAKAAEIGTDKVISDHATVGILVTTDGSFGDIPRNNYVEPEKMTLNKLRAQKKPFIMILNSAMPEAEETISLAEKLSEEYHTNVLPVNVQHMTKQDIVGIMEAILMEFPVTEIEFGFPKWVEALPMENEIKTAMINLALEIMGNANVLRDLYSNPYPQSEYIDSIRIAEIATDTGKVALNIGLKEDYYYQILSGILGEPVENEYDFMQVLKQVSAMRKEYVEVADALKCAKGSGYGCVTPGRQEITLDEPVIIKHGNKYGVKITAKAPSMHLIKANVTTEIAPIVGTKEQAEDLITYIKEDTKEHPENIWDVNIFGKSLDQLVSEGMHGKTTKLTSESQAKLQESMEKIVNESNGGLVCIII